MKKIILSTACGIFLVLVIVSFRPISISKENSQTLKGVIRTVNLSTTKDLEITLTGDKRTFYINRATDKNLDIQKLVDNLPSKTVTLLYADQWTILDPLGSYRHITEMTVDKDLIFTELN